MIRNKLFLQWIFVFFVGVFIVSNSHYKSSNDDSKYYSDLVVRYQNETWQNILSPLWGVNYYSYAPSAYMRDQLPGQLIMGVAVTKLGIPAAHALHVLEMVFQILSIWLLVKIVLEFVPIDLASSIYYGILLTPMAFSYNLRGNHEMGVMFFCLLAIYAGLKLSNSKFWSLVSAFSCAMLLMIKGPFFIFGLILTTIGFLFSKKRAAFKDLLLALIVSSICIFLTAYLFEQFYLKYTGQSFFLEFYRIQIQQRAMQSSHEHSYLVQKLFNFNYYFVNYFTYSLPWCLWAFLSIAKNRKDPAYKIKLMSFLNSKLSFCLLLSASVFCFVFAMSDRTATRYVFPAYYLFSTWLIVLLGHTSSHFQTFHEKIKIIGIHYMVAILWFVALALHFLR